ncbi:MmgE/PrpD family protein [Bordetella sp. BOR01]|uniref:MmgE/PrpD family protein n=1 Tax=Bordetella sp. BOR01 TaxID=2854779 RepID=UPI001C43C0FE|nr:MmgE/PrpD family protein [Bordetella sp. BOR01]MBV7483217.1 MmgE/PrpD family protein [Bordetella sp. BOR01]
MRQADMTPTVNQVAAQWMSALAWNQIPADLVASAKLRILDTLGVALAASAQQYGDVMGRAVADFEQPGPCRVLGMHLTTGPAWAALANGMLAHALIFDDTHSASIVHPTSPLLAATLAAGEKVGATGQELLLALIGGTELACRIGLVAQGGFHVAGFQPTAIAGPFGCAYAASRLYGLDAARTGHAAGIAGSMAGGINESWTDGTWAQIMHPGWAAHSGITAATLAKSGYSGPGTVFEGRFGLFRTHIQRDDFQPDFTRITDGLGEDWQGRHIVFKPYPCAHVIHPFLDAILEMRRQGLRAEDVERVVCPIAEYMVRIVCAPADEKRRPLGEAQARTSLQYSLAEALCTGRLDAGSYSPANMADPAILALADRIEHAVDDAAPDSRAYKGWVIVQTKDGRREKIVPHTRGSAENPMSRADVLAKFSANASLCLPKQRVDAIVQAVGQLEHQSVRQLMALCVPEEAPA